MLTEEGKILKEHVYKIFFDIEQTKADIKNYSGKSRSQIKIGASGSKIGNLDLEIGNFYNMIVSFC